MTDYPQSLGDFLEIKMVALICGKPKLTVDITTLKSFVNVVARNVKIEKTFLFHISLWFL